MTDTSEGNGTWAASSAPAPTDALSTLVAERPEVAVGAAFAGGLIMAMIVRRLGR